MRSWPWPVRVVTRRPRWRCPGCGSGTSRSSRSSAHASCDQVKDNLGCVGVKLEPEQIARLDAVSRIEMGFPHDFFATEMVRALSSGGMRDKIDA